MPLSAAGSSLVAGGGVPSKESNMQTQRVKVTRAFFFERKPLAVGTEVDLPLIFAREVIASNKAERVDGKQETTPASRAKEQKPLV